MKKFLILSAVISLLQVKVCAQTNANIVIEKEIVYGRSGGVDLKFDLAKPIGEGPFPVILFFHGGGWQAGDKSHGHHWISMFADSGYVGISVAYRFAPAFKWPSQVNDAKAAVRYVRANADKLGIDPDRIGVMGESAGGYLASMVGMTDAKDKLEGDGGSVKFSSRVRAVVSYFSSADFTLPKATLSPEVEESVFQYYKKTLPEVMADFMGTATPDAALLKIMSVVTYVDKHDPSVLIFQGDADPFVSVAQAKAFDEKLSEARVPHELVLVNGGGHGWTGEMKQKTDLQMMAFFNRELKRK